MQFYDVKAGLCGVSPNPTRGKICKRVCVMGGNHTRITPLSGDKTALTKPRKLTGYTNPAATIINRAIRKFRKTSPHVRASARLSAIVRNPENRSTHLSTERIAAYRGKYRDISRQVAGVVEHPELTAIAWDMLPELTEESMSMNHEFLKSLKKGGQTPHGSIRSTTGESHHIAPFPDPKIAGKLRNESRHHVVKNPRNPELLSSIKRKNLGVAGSIRSIHSTTIESNHIEPFSGFQSIAIQLPGGS